MIYGEKVRLRAVERDDLPRFVEWFNDPDVTLGLTMAVPLSTTAEERWFEELQDQDPPTRPLSIDAREGDGWAHIGSCGLHRLDQRSRNAELGISIGDKSYWDRGFGTDAMRCLLRHGFDTLNLHRIYLRVFEFNARAIAVYRKLGFQEEGRLREDMFREGRYWDTMIMGILRDEWLARSSAGG